MRNRVLSAAFFRRKNTGILAVFLVMLAIVPGITGELPNGKAVKGSTGAGGQRYAITVPPDALLLTVVVTSQKRGDHLNLYLNKPDAAGYPGKGNSSYESENRFDGGSSEYIWIASQEALSAGEYRISVEKVGKEGCDYFITAQYQTASEIRLGEEAVASTNDDQANGSKFFYCDIGDGYDFLDIVVGSETKNNALDLYVNTPAAAYYPSTKSFELSSTNRFDQGNQEWVFINPPDKVAAGRYRISVWQPGKDACEQFKIRATAEKIPVLTNKKPTKMTTRRHGEYFYFSVPEGARKVTIKTDSIVKDNILDLYVNNPFDEAFPTPKAYRYSSETRFDKGANETIVIEEPDEGIYYIWVRNLVPGKDYAIRASFE